jgi:hypothetical protein
MRDHAAHENLTIGLDLRTCPRSSKKCMTASATATRIDLDWSKVPERAQFRLRPLAAVFIVDSPQRARVVAARARAVAALLDSLARTSRFC